MQNSTIDEDNNNNNKKSTKNFDWKKKNKRKSHNAKKKKHTNKLKTFVLFRFVGCVFSFSLRVFVTMALPRPTVYWSTELNGMPFYIYFTFGRNFVKSERQHGQQHNGIDNIGETNTI